METRYGRKLTLEIKPDTDNSTFNKNIWHILPVPLKPETINSALRHQCRYVIQLKIIIILITTFHSVRVTNKPQSVSNAAYNFPGSYSATGIRNWATQQTWLDWFFGFVSLAVQRLPNFLFPHFQCRVFLLPRYISVPSTLNIAFIWASRNSLRLWNCAQHEYSQLTFRRQRPSRDHRWSGWPL